MSAVIPAVSPDLLAWRKRTGADRWDERWEGVLHMASMPNEDEPGSRNFQEIKLHLPPTLSQKSGVRDRKSWGPSPCDKTLSR